MAVGLFQIQDKRNFPTRPDAKWLSDPENNIKYAAQTLGAARGKWSDWGEGVLHKGKKFGALGNNPFPGDGGGMSQEPGSDSGIPAGMTRGQFGQSLFDALAKGLGPILGQPTGADGQLKPAYQAIYGFLQNSLADPNIAKLNKTREDLMSQMAQVAASGGDIKSLQNQIANIDLVLQAGQGLGMAPADTQQPDYAQQMNAYANLLGSMVSLGGLKAGEAAQKVKGYNDQYEAGLVSPTGYQFNQTPGSFLRGQLGLSGGGNDTWMTKKQDAPDSQDTGSFDLQTALAQVLGMMNGGGDGTGDPGDYQPGDYQSSETLNPLNPTIEIPWFLQTNSSGTTDRGQQTSNSSPLQPADQGERGGGGSGGSGGSWLGDVLSAAQVPNGSNSLNHLLSKFFPGAALLPLKGQVQNQFSNQQSALSKGAGSFFNFTDRFLWR